MKKSMMAVLAGSSMIMYAVFASSGAAAEKGVNLSPYKMTTTNGNHSDQPITVLAVEEQTDSDDYWYSYIEFTPDRRFFTTFVFDIPEINAADEWRKITLSTNYRGAESSQQRWVWQVKNFCSDRWQTLGDNSQAVDWQWSHMSFDAPGDPDCFINANGKIEVQYKTNSTYDVSFLDSLLITLVQEVEVDPPEPDETPSGPEVLPPVATSWWQPTPSTSWQWQLSGNIDTALKVDMYDVDLVETSQETIDELHADGRVVICYFSAGSWENYRDDAALFPQSVVGSTLDGWPDEKWLDIREIDKLAPVMEARLDEAVRKGCDGIEPDNIDGYTNDSGFALTYQDQLNYNKWLAQKAHERSLSIGLKNDLEQIEDLVEHFDWALNEECFQYNECSLLTPFVEAGKAVFGVEYTGDIDTFCPQANAMNFNWLYKNFDLDAYRKSCR